MKRYLKISAICLVFAALSCKDSSSNVQNSSNGNPKIRLKGSESEYNLIKYMSDQFNHKTGNNVSIELAGGGSGVGIESLLRHEIDIANSSRVLSEEEQQKASQNGIVPLPIVIATDAVAIITNSSNPIDSLSLYQLAGIFSGSINNWQDVGGPNLPIKIICRDEHSGTHHYILTRLNIKEYAKGSMVKHENAEIIQSVKNETGAIGYVNLGSLIDISGLPVKDVWPISPYFEGGKAHSPYETDAVRCGDYPLIRPLYQYVIGYPTGKVLDLLKFETSDEMQKKLEAHGYFPLSEMHRTLNRKNVKGL